MPKIGFSSTMEVQLLFATIDTCTQGTKVPDASPWIRRNGIHFINI
jgi:hypothetical protein